MRLDRGTLIIAAAAVAAAIGLGALSGAVSGLLSALAGLVSSAIWQVATERRARKIDESARIQHARETYPGPAAVGGGGVARYLRPEARIVPFWPRPELQQLLDWVVAPGPLAVQLVTGEGGTGKTRLLLELAERVRQQAWQVKWVPSGAEQAAMADARQIPEPTLLVIDYAETRHELENFLASIFDETDKSGLRVVFLARSEGEWWQRLINQSAYHASESLARSHPIKLGALSVASKSSNISKQAISAFATEIGVADRDIAYASPAPGSVVLTFHAAALLAVLDRLDMQLGVPAHESEKEALDGLLRHEARYWQQGQAARHLDLDTTTLQRVVAAANLVGADNESSAVALLTRVSADTASARQWEPVARWLHDLYPASISQTPREWLGQLQPDLVAERLIVSVFDQWPELVARYFCGLTGERARRALTILARAARNDQRAVGQLEAALTADIENLAVAALSVAVETNAQLGVQLEHVLSSADVSVEVLERLANALPFPSSVLAEVAIVVLRQAVQKMADHPARRAERLIELSNWLTEAGHRDDALSTINEAVSYYRRLASVNPQEYSSVLASAITSQSNSLSDCGIKEESLLCINEAVELRRVLAEADPSDAGRARDLAVSLNNWSARLSDLDRSAEAYVVIIEAVRIERSFAENMPEIFLPMLGSSLNNLSNCYVELGKLAESLGAVEEAVDICRTLSETKPDAFIPRLAASLINQAFALADLDREEEAIVALDEATNYYRGLSERQPQKFLPYIGLLLSNRCEYLLKLGRVEEGLIAIEESVAIRRALAEREPQAFMPSLIESLKNLAEARERLGLDVAAEAARAEAIFLSSGNE